MDLIMAKERRERPQLSLDVGCGTYPETILVRLRMVVLFHLESVCKSRNFEQTPGNVPLAWPS